MSEKVLIDVEKKQGKFLTPCVDGKAPCNSGVYRRAVVEGDDGWIESDIPVVLLGQNVTFEMLDAAVVLPLGGEPSGGVVVKFHDKPDETFFIQRDQFNTCISYE